MSCPKRNCKHMNKHIGNEKIKGRRLNAFKVIIDYKLTQGISLYFCLIAVISGLALQNS